MVRKKIWPVFLIVLSGCNLSAVDLFGTKKSAGPTITISSESYADTKGFLSDKQLRERQIVPPDDHGEDLSGDDINLLVRQLAVCWSTQAGTRFADDLKVKLHLSIDEKRRVAAATVVDQARYNRDASFRMAADSAIRAVNSPKCDPLILPPSKYDAWKDMVITFDPKNMR